MVGDYFQVATVTSSIGITRQIPIDCLLQLIICCIFESYFDAFIPKNWIVPKYKYYGLDKVLYCSQHTTLHKHIKT